MSEDILKEELYKIAILAVTSDFTDSETVDKIKAENSFSTPFGMRFVQRISEIRSHVDDSHKCVVCGRRIAINGVICDECIPRILDSEYAKHQKELEAKKVVEEALAISSNTIIEDNSHETSKEKRVTLKDYFVRLKSSFMRKKSVAEEPVKKSNISTTEKAVKKSNISTTQEMVSNKKGKSRVAVIILGALAVVQLVVLVSYNIINASPYKKSELPPDSGEVNPIEKPYVSDRDLVYSEDVEAARVVVAEEFPADNYWEIRDCPEDIYYLGYFISEKGKDLSEVEANLSEDEKFDFYIGEKCYVFIVSYRTQNCLKMGTVVVRPEGQMIVKGVFNDGRNPDAFYRIR